MVMLTATDGCRDKKEGWTYDCPVVLTTVILNAYSRSKGRAATRSTKNQVVA